jgi:hypothetical protein
MLTQSPITSDISSQRFDSAALPFDAWFPFHRHSGGHRHSEGQEFSQSNLVSDDQT